MSDKHKPTHMAAPRASISSSQTYDRRRDLPRLLPLWPHEIDVADGAAHARLIARMRRALRMERQRGQAGHWAYDLARHAALLRAYRAEVAS
ncbi:MAG TPA: hypothetical protein VNR51_00865, partial [Hyphomicrobium sp.]|nr:hypothetical protein [Hyphomicrobium sp.]